MNWKKVIGFGVLLWLCMFLIVSLLTAWQVYYLPWARIVVPLIAGVIAFGLAGLVKPNRPSLALACGLLWIVIGIILDALVNWQINFIALTSWALWVGFVPVLIAPLLQIKKG